MTAPKQKKPTIKATQKAKPLDLNNTDFDAVLKAMLQTPPPKDKKSSEKAGA